MGDESEKRFEEIMNKLFHGPLESKLKSDKTSVHGVQLLRGRKRPNSSESSTLTSSGTSLCRPWNRDDLFERFSTFKSMTWFAKPQAVSPVNCSRKGWINVDMDTIACTSCGARLLFSTPLAWSLQQVEKAALVFSLKLETGHKLLCPWIDNACSEELAQFPTVSRADMIEDYKKRVLSLSQLTALPIISPIAIDNIRNPQLEEFLKEISTAEYLVPVDETGSTSSISYYQVQKLTSLCGWEPHLLPYIVDFKDGPTTSIRDTNATVSNQKVNISCLCSNEVGPAELQLDPNSVVLDCHLCGASVGLWAFLTVGRPVEFVRLVGTTQVNGKNDSSIGQVISAPEDSLGGEIHATNAITIAGGLPPAMLNYNATISLPVIGKSLRARIPEVVDVITTGGTLETDQNLLDDVAQGYFNLQENETVSTTSHSDTAFKQVSRPILEDNPASSSIKDPNVVYKAIEFDPIKQHRHFCPWVASGAKFFPGWKQTLSALQGHKTTTFSPNSCPVSSLIEVDDPVSSVKRLFTSPNKKRTKITTGGN